MVTYSFGNLLTIALYQKYRKEGSNFVEKYLKILSAGGSENPERLLAKIDINLKSEKFWQEGFNYIKLQTDKLEKNLKK